MKTKFLLYVTFLTFLFPKMAYAYLDAGSGSYLIQLAIAGALGSTIFFRSALKKVKELFKKQEPSDKPTNDNDE